MGRLAVITYLDEMGSGNFPDNSLPSGGRPDNSLPPGATQLPVYPFDPTIDNSLPTPPGGHVDNGLPVPGKRFIVKYLACKGLILVPDNSLPGTPVHPDNSLPGSGARPSHPIAPGSPARPDNSLPSTPEPKK